MPGLSAASWPLLLWSGLAAAIASEWVAGLGAATVRPRERSSAPRLMTRPRGSTIVHILAGVLVFAPLYGLAFEIAGRASLTLGATLGAVHGILVTAWALLAAIRGERKLRPTPRAVFLHRVGRSAVQVIYGAVLGFLYVVPAA